MDYWKRNWLFEPIYDKEFKHYQILGFEQASKSHFKAFRLFPYLENLTRQIKSINEYRLATDRIVDGIKPRLIGADLLQGALHYSTKMLDDKGMQEWQDVLNFAEEKLQTCFEVAQQHIELATEAVHIRPIGLQDQGQRTGLLFIKEMAFTKVYRFESRVVRRPINLEAYRDLRTTFIEYAQTSLQTNYAELKWHYLKNDQVNGINAYLVETEMELPFFECVLPIVKAFVIGRE